MGEQAGAAILALALALLGFGLIVAGVRGTYGDVWAAARATAGAGSQPQTGTTTDTTGAGGIPQG